MPLWEKRILWYLSVWSLRCILCLRRSKQKWLRCFLRREQLLLQKAIRRSIFGPARSASVAGLCRKWRFCANNIRSAVWHFWLENMWHNRLLDAFWAFGLFLNAFFFFLNRRLFQSLKHKLFTVSHFHHFWEIRILSISFIYRNTMYFESQNGEGEVVKMVFAKGASLGANDNRKVCLFLTLHQSVLCKGRV